MAKPLLLTLSVLLVLFSVPGYAQTPAFSSDIVEGCAPLVVKFKDETTGGTPVSWEWDMGNGTVLYQQNPSATFINPGTYNVKLTINKGNGEKSVTKNGYIKVYATPVVAFSSTNSTGCFPLPVKFTDESTPGSGSINKWEWDFGDGSPFSDTKNAEHTYGSVGSYHVTLRVTNSNGCVKTLGKQHYVTISTGAKADFDFNTPSSCNPPTPVTFTDKSVASGPLTYEWSFGDGGKSSDASPTYSYTKTGTYSVSLTVTNESGCKNTITKSNIINIGSVKADFTAPAKVCAGQSVNIANTSSPEPNASTWSFGGAVVYGNTPYYAFPSPGKYTIKLNSHFGGCTVSKEKEIEVLGKPAIDFKADKTSACEAPATFAFTAQTTETGLTYKWDFGDFKTSTEQNPKHTYTANGNYTVSLTATNSAGCTETITKYHYINIREPRVGLYADHYEGCAPLTISPQAWVDWGETITNYTWVWANGDTTKGTANPTHTYTDPGQYVFKLIYTTASGCTRTVSAFAGAGQKPDLKFSATPAFTCAFKSIQFTDNTTGVLPNTWFWQFGDGHWSIDKNPHHYYSDTGYFDVQLIAANFGCADTLVMKDIVRINGPIALFTDSSGCSQRNTRWFKDHSIDAKSWFWNFGDGNTSTEKNPKHTYAAKGNYTVTLTVKNDTCEHTGYRQITIAGQVTDFSASKTSVCTAADITFTAQNSNSTDIYYQYWEFGDGQANYYYNSVTHRYNRPGEYTVKLITYDRNGCVDTITKPEYIKINGPKAGFMVPDGTICANTPVVITDTSIGNPSPLVSWKWDYGDRTTETKTGGPFSHVYKEPGSYLIQLTVTDQAGCSSSAQEYGRFNIAKPTADFTSPDLVSCTGKPIRFFNSSYGAMQGFEWSFGDGISSKAYDTVINYLSEGLFDVKLIAKDIFGCTDTLVKQQYIKIGNPRAIFTVSDSIASCPPLLIDFRNKSLNYNSYQWDFGDNTRPAPNENPSHFYNFPGEYMAKLTITSPGGCIDSMKQKLVVKGPTGDFSYDVLEGCRPLKVSFKGRTNSPAEFIWDYNDGTVQPGGPDIAYHYTSMGQYLPKMILVDPDGCRVPFPGPDTITVLGAEAQFGPNTDLVCDSGYVHFTNLSYSNERITNYLWTFEAGRQSIATEPSHFYSTPGRYPVQLIAITESGCRDTTVSDFLIKVALNPIVDFNGDTSVCMPATLRFNGDIIRNDSSTLKWEWDFGNGAKAASQHPVSANYRDQRDHTVRLIATTTLECKDTVTRIVSALPIPKINAGEDKTIPVGSETKIITNYSPDVISIAWTPITGLSCADCVEPVAAPKKTTTYRVDVENNVGCKNYDEITVFVFCNNGNLFMPNTFSPNNDGSNDVYYPRGKGLFRVKAFKIFNRWGELVFEKYDFNANDITRGWNGYYNNKPASQDVYVYSIDIVCENGSVLNYKGNVALIR